MLGQGHGKRMHRAPLLPLLCPTLRDPWAVRPMRTRSSPRCRQALGPQHEPCLSPLCTCVHISSSSPSTNPAQHLTQSFLRPCLDSGPPFNVMSALPPWASAVWLPWGLPSAGLFPLPLSPASGSIWRSHSQKGNQYLSLPLQPPGPVPGSPLCCLARVSSPSWVPCLWLAHLPLSLLPLGLSLRVVFL